MNYTVVLLVPDYLADQYGEDTRTVYAHGATVTDAIAAAQLEASEADIEVDPIDFRVLFVCSGFQPDLKDCE